MNTTYGLGLSESFTKLEADTLQEALEYIPEPAYPYLVVYEEDLRIIQLFKWNPDLQQWEKEISRKPTCHFTPTQAKEATP